MANKESIYSKVEEAQDIIEKLCTKQPDVLWRIKSDNVIVMGIENKKRGKKNRTLAKVRPIKGSERAIMQLNGIPTRYIIELYWSDWNEWGERFKQWLMLHELLHISEEEGKTVHHDSEDFKIILDKVGVEWANPKAQLPDLLNDDVDFNLDLRPGLDRMAEESDEIPEPEPEPQEENDSE